MYDILQLNDLLLPVLQDIAQGLKITGFKKLDKQALIYKILDSQAVSEASAKDDGKKKPALKGRKPVTVKTSNGTEEAEVMSEEPAAAPAQKGRPIKKANQRPERPERPEKAEAPAAVAAAVPENADTAQAPENAEAAQAPENTTPSQHPPRPHKKEPVFNIEFEGMIEGEGVLEMMPDGYGFLRSSDYNY